MHLVGSGLSCVRGGREVFAGLDFVAAAGELIAVVGPNGAGKTSLLRMIAGLVRVAQGTLALEHGTGDLTLAEQAHYVGHLDAVKPSLSVRENLQFWAAYLGGAGVPVAGALDKMGLLGLADLPAAYLSAGQRRRLSIARLMAAQRPIWLLDEPTSALDRASQGRLVDIMRGHLGAGGIILAATHAPLGIGGTRELRLGEAS
jgi:heme exporter protein A